VIEGDALKTDFEALAPEGPGEDHRQPALQCRHAACWSTGCCRSTWPPFWQSLTLMFQKEVGQRIVADGRRRPLWPPRRALWLAYDAHMAFDIPPQAFTPPPKVTSTVVHLTPNENPIPCSVANLEKVTHGRLRPAPQDAAPEPEIDRRREAAGQGRIDPQRRAETLSVEEFCLLANSL
jgi:16S rRNA (adenine1518-N6/adenine1519-N6)-dimethyltransferase